MTEHHNKRIQNIIQKELFKAKNSIKIAVAWFTNELLFEPLLLKLQTGVKVELVLNKDEINNSENNEINFSDFINYGGFLHWNDSNRLMHEKFCIIDDKIVIYGSYNWTNKAEYNDESIAISRNENTTSSFFLETFTKLCSKYPAEEIKEDKTQHSKPKETSPQNSCTENKGKVVFHNDLYSIYEININNPDNPDIIPIYRVMLGNQKTFLKYDFSAFIQHTSQIAFLFYKNRWHFLDEEGWHILAAQGSFLELGELNVNSIVIRTKPGGKWGVSDFKGHFLIPCEYDKIEFLSIHYRPEGRRWYRTDEFWKIKKGDLYGLSDDSWNIIIPCEYDAINSLTINIFCGEIIFWKVRKDNLFGISNSAGVFMIPCKYDEIEYLTINRTYSHRLSHLFWKVKKDNLFGLFGISLYDRYKNIIIPCEYEEYHEYEEYQQRGDETPIFWKLKKNNNYGVINSKGDIIIDFKYQKVLRFEEHIREGQTDKCIPIGLDFLSEYYPLFITKDWEGMYGVCGNGVERCRVVSGKDIFNRIGIPEFDLCEHQEDQVLEDLRFSLTLDILNEVFDFSTAPWAKEVEIQFLKSIDDFKVHAYRLDVRKQLYHKNSKYINAPLFYLAHPGHTCFDVSCIQYSKQNDYKYPLAFFKYITVCRWILPDLSTKLRENDVLIIPKNIRTFYKMNNVLNFPDRGFYSLSNVYYPYYFWILQVVNLSSKTTRYIEFHFAIFVYQASTKLKYNRGGNVIELLKEQNSYDLDDLIGEHLSKSDEHDIVKIITKNRSTDAFIKLTNLSKEKCKIRDTNIFDYHQFSYDFADKKDIQNVKKILSK